MVYNSTVSEALPGTLLSRSVYSEVSQDNLELVVPDPGSVSDMVLSSALETAALPEASGEDYYTVLSTQWADYLSGIVSNMGYTDYFAYCFRDYDSGSLHSYTEHYILVYDVELDVDAELVSGDYPYIDIYRSSSSSEYMRSEGYTTVAAVPDVAYGSFGTLSELRKGGGVHETYVFLFSFCVAFVFVVISRIFDTVLQLGSRKS